MAKKVFVLHEEVMDVFNNFFNITTIEKPSFHLDHVSIIGSTECGKTRTDCLRAIIHQTNIKLKKDHVEKFSEATGTEIQSQNWGGNRQFSMEDISVEYFPTSIVTSKNEEKYELN